ncbi:hypothetical protein N7462_003747 [Penicillium macrosclerotiorum]|uniref:uncharacterized protein n=1 Tax=Penicillium macrosclerotiorum TaxID=303699 RepID=UPI0025467C96|nr:uncharacterized protein N7462_003747 [Penicillium macrosclerotiorum]KAJ5689355.1 hypothetical protein N7462_003747 [Penicillium macrosclerotiorum]
MLRPLNWLPLPLQSRCITVWNRCGVATATHKHHPNPANFANRPREELSAMGRRGGKKGGKVRGVGGFHDMDPEKQHEIASKGGRASRKAGIELEKAVNESKVRKSMPSSQEPSVMPPGFEEWKP